MKSHKFYLVAVVLVLFTSVFAGCGGSGSGSSSGGSGTGTLSLALTDATTLAYRAVYVTIARVEVHLGGNENNPNNWETVAEPNETYNLLELVNGVLAQLGLNDLEAGIYTQIRLIIGTSPDAGTSILGTTHPHANYIILSGTNAVHPLFVPSGIQTGIKLVEEFTINEGETTELILDFDAARSVVKAGASGLWLLKPTIRVLHAGEVSYIEGVVVDENSAGLRDALVTAQVSGTQPVDISAFASRTEADGSFRLLVRPGVTYNIVAYKDGYGSDAECGITAPALGQTIELARNLQLSTSEFGEVEVSVTGLGNEGDVSVSFRVPGCGGMIEVTSSEVGPGGEDLTLPAGNYTWVAWSEEGEATLQGTITVQSGDTTPLVIDF